MFEDLNETSTKAVNVGQKYIESSKEYFKLKIFQQLAISISLVGKVLAVGSFIFIAFLFFAICSAILLGEWLESYALGSFIVGLIAFMISLILYFIRGKINTIVISKLSEKF